MTLTIHNEEDDKRQMTLRVEVPEERVAAAMRDKARELSRELRIPGFRRGKVPYSVMLRRLGRETLRVEAVEDMAQAIFQEALAQAEVDPYAQPTMDDMELEPLVFTFTVPLEPVVTLGAYRDLRKEVEAIDITDEAIDSALKQVQDRHAKVEEVERPLAMADIATISGKGELVGRVESDEAEAANEGEGDAVPAAAPEMIFDEESIDLLMDPEVLFPNTPFVENLLGLSTGESKAFSFVFPEEFEQEDFAGREATFEVTVLNVKQRDLPPLDDELAKLEGNVESLEELRSDIADGLREQAENQAKNELIDGMVDQLLEDAELVYPPAAVEAEIDDMVESFKEQVTRAGWQLEDFLRIQGSTEEGLREDFRENAEDRLKRRLVMRQFILDEMLRVELEDVDALIEGRIARYENEDLRKGLREFYRSGSGFDAISSEVLSEKVYERIKAIYAGEAPDLEALATALAEAVDEEE